MNYRDVASTYREASFENAPPVKIVRMMYEGAIKHLERARRLDPRESGLAFNEALSRADAIVSELRLSLDKPAAAEICTQLEGLYLFVEDRIALAFSERSGDSLEAGVGVLRTLLDAWRQIDVVEQAA
jgi:flagellar secretion chaperone FliS